PQRSDADACDPIPKPRIHRPGVLVRAPIRPPVRVAHLVVTSVYAPSISADSCRTTRHRRPAGPTTNAIPAIHVATHTRQRSGTCLDARLPMALAGSSAAWEGRTCDDVSPPGGVRER